MLESKCSNTSSWIMNNHVYRKIIISGVSAISLMAEIFHALKQWQLFDAICRLWSILKRAVLDLSLSTLTAVSHK